MPNNHLASCFGSSSVAFKNSFHYVQKKFKNVALHTNNLQHIHSLKHNHQYYIFAVTIIRDGFTIMLKLQKILRKRIKEKEQTVKRLQNTDDFASLQTARLALKRYRSALSKTFT